MGGALELGPDGLHDVRVGVADIHHADAADEVDEPAPVDVPELGALGPVGDQRMGGGDASRDVLRAKLGQLRLERLLLDLHLGHSSRYHRRQWRDSPAAAVERLWPGRRASVTVLGGGITNHNFKVEVDGAAYVLRMGGAKTGLLGIDRAVEHAASLRAEEIGIGPPVADFVASEGWLVTRFIEGRPIAVEEMRSASTLPRVAEALRKLHSARAIPGRFDSFAVVDTYLRRGRSERRAPT